MKEFATRTVQIESFEQSQGSRIASKREQLPFQADAVSLWRGSEEDLQHAHGKLKLTLLDIAAKIGRMIFHLREFKFYPISPW